MPMPEELSDRLEIILEYGISPSVIGSEELGLYKEELVDIVKCVYEAGKADALKEAGLTPDRIREVLEQVWENGSFYGFDETTQFLWETYALEKDENLSPDAQKIKDSLWRVFEFKPKSVP